MEQARGPAESKIGLLKMKGDYLRSLAESSSSSSPKKQIVVEASDQAYSEALEASRGETVGEPSRISWASGRFSDNVT